MLLYVLIAAYIILVVLLHIRKSRQTGSKQAKKVAFFHPFWYSYFYLVMMVVEDKKSYGQ
jgi:hypothetical protein